MVYSSPVSLTQTDFTAQCQNAKNAGVEAFGMGVDGSAIARVARSCAALDYFPQFISGGGVISPAQSKDPGIRRNTMSVASANAPWMLTDTPGQKEYAEALAQYAPGMETDGNSMTAWASAEAASRPRSRTSARRPEQADHLRRRHDRSRQDQERDARRAFAADHLLARAEGRAARSNASTSSC